MFGDYLRWLAGPHACRSPPFSHAFTSERADVEGATTQDASVQGRVQEFSTEEVQYTVHFSPLRKHEAAAIGAGSVVELRKSSGGRH